MKTKKLSYIILILFLLIEFTNTAQVIPITGTVTDDSNYNKADFLVSPEEENYYFKYSFATTPTSRIGAFRFDFNQFDKDFTNKEVLCTFVDASATDDQIITILDSIKKETSSCIGDFVTEQWKYDGIFEYDKTKKMLIFKLKIPGELTANVALYVRNKDTTLAANEQEVNDHSEYSLIPYTIHISQFREVASKVLFYSKTRDLQMYYVEGDSPYPERLFFGNIMSVYTNPNMVRQKYKNAQTMILLTRPFNMEEPMGEAFIFQIKLFASDYLLDYYMGTNPKGREKNSPLAINMTECAEPYYVILNYNQPEGKVSLYIDEIYGKIKSLSVAPSFTKNRWEDMIANDLKEIDITERKYELPKDSKTHMDVYKVECSEPLLLNFYYVDESSKIPDLDYGQVAITTLKANKIISLPFSSGISAPQLTIEVFNPKEAPFVMVNDGYNEYIVNKNSLIKSTTMTTQKALVIKERGGNDNTRIIVKLGYNTLTWEKKTDNVKYNSEYNMYVFSFPVGAKRYNYTYAFLETSGTNAEDNVKYCYGTNIGSAILPSSENCYRVSKDNSYTIKVMNPAVMYKDYDLDENLIYYVSMKPMNKGDTFNIKETIVEYKAKGRNFESHANVIELGSATESTILGYPKINEESVFYQITSCSNKDITYSIFNAYKSTDQIVPDTKIAANTQNYFSKFDNVFAETELKLTGTQGDKIFVKHIGVNKIYQPSIKSSFSITFDPSKNAIIFPRPFTNSERSTFTVYVTPEGGLSSKSLTLCSFVDPKEPIAEYSRTFSTYTDGYSLPINFKKIGLSKGQKFEAIAYIEQDYFSHMSLMTNLLTDTVGEIKEETITQINTPHSGDIDYVYYRQEPKAETSSFYYSFKNDDIFDVPMGVFRIELDSDAEGSFNMVQCAWVNDGEDAISMVEAVEDVIDSHDSYCYGGQDKVKPKVYNYIFKYTYTSDNKARRMVIKVPEVDKNTGYTIYIRKGENTIINQTGFNEIAEYGKQEEYKLSRMLYILDLTKIRGDDSVPDYVSKVLIYSKHLEMQMYYLNEEKNSPQRLFTGNVMLVYTKPSLAKQKYFGTQLILLSEYIRGQDHSGLGNSFRFHTKMFRSTDQIEYFVSNNPFGRTLNFPLSIEMNTCNGFNKNYYYILNYNSAEEKRNLYLDLIFGSINTVRIVTELTEEKWDDLINNKMQEITDYFTTIPERSQHIDIVEIRCNTPLLANIYYNYDNYPYYVSQGEVVIKNLAPKETFTFDLNPAQLTSVFYSIEIFNPKGEPNMVVNFEGGASTTIKENSLTSGILFSAPDSINIVNNGYSLTRFIFKVGFEVDNSWNKEQGYDIDGTLFSSENKFVYKFPLGDKKKNFTNVEITVKPMKKESEPLSENIKFCYSTSLGMAIESSQENCFRTGANIPYSLTFVNPLISPKNYKSYSDNYYVTLSPQSGDQYISLDIIENKYDTKERNIEGYGKIITLDEGDTKSTILSIPESFTNNKMILQLQICVSSSQIINFSLYNAYTNDYISNGNISPREKFFYSQLSNNLMETKLEFKGQQNEKLFVKHTGVDDYNIKIEGYSATFDKSVNTVTIIKPIFNEEFTITVLVGKRGRFTDYTLCTFTDITKSEFEKLGDYVYSFSSVSSNEIPHYIDFRSFKEKGYDVDAEFDLLVYAVQTHNSKLEFLYPVISGVVGRIEHIFAEIEGTAQSNIVTHSFYKNSSNYLYYDFTSIPEGDVASLKIINEGDVSVTITKVICTFVEKGKTDEEMLKIINEVPLGGINYCKGDDKKSSAGFNALINANKVKNDISRFLIMIQYGFGEEKMKEDKHDLKDDVQLRINIRVTGFDVSKSDKEYNENEENALVPYFLDLAKIRESGSGGDYISKVLIYSSKRELEMFHLQDGTPTQLFTGNILLVFTNPEVIKEKYSGAKIMILLTESLYKEPIPIIGEHFRFKTYFFKSDNTRQYYVSSDPTGRPINIPTSMEMPSCDKPYYYILNYHNPEPRDLTLHIDQIYGELSSKRIATELNKEDWYDLIAGMEDIYEDEYLINQKDKYHMDVIEARCTIPSLLHIYYTDDANPILTGLVPGKTSIINLAPTVSKDFELQTNVIEGYNLVYSFNVLLEDEEPKVRISFPSGEPIVANKNGIYIRKSTTEFKKITLKNEEISGSSKVRIIFKYGYEIEDKFDPIDNDIYHYNETANLYGYKFKTEDDWLNYTSVSFLVSTGEDNVKFCYSSNLGSYMEPSMQDCYRVGISNTYTLTILNPYLMYKDYTTAANEIMKYYVGFKTVNRNQAIKITPTLNKYSTNLRNMENIATSITVTKNTSTILTAPAENTQFIFLQMQVCTDSKVVEIDLLNAYNRTSLGYGDYVDSYQNIYYRTIENIKLDTELNMLVDTSAKVFVKHVGINEEYYPGIDDIILHFDKANNTITFNQPITEEEFKYTIYVDQKGNIKDKNYNLCSVAENDKLAPYSKEVTSAEETITEIIDFNSTELKEHKEFDILVKAEQINYGKLVILSKVIQVKIKEEGGQQQQEEDSSNTELIIIIVVLTVIVICGGIIISICLRRYRNKPVSKRLDAKQTSLTMVDNENEKMVMSTASERNY